MNRFGKRYQGTNRMRLACLILLVIVVSVLEIHVVGRIADEKRLQLELSDSNWAIKRYLGAPGSSISALAVTKTKTRILYISNSHAKTGGEVSKHLQAILDLVSPGHFEILDMSEAGIFGTDFLQRTLMGLELQPDIILVGSAYISFSDRMRLSRQSHNARSFFKNGVFDKLKPGFWLRHFDLGLYIDTWLEQQFNLVRYRNELRNSWVVPLAESLKPDNNRSNIFFLEVDTKLGWKFPEGYDNNLFQWRLYAAGRARHLQDLRDLVSATKDANVSLMVLNLPIHWQKSVYPHDENDYQLFQTELEDISAGVLEYVDYQDYFPKEFTTYDALHPTWFGARLHALDIALRLKKHRFFSDSISYESILQHYFASGQLADGLYVGQLNGHYPPLSTIGFRRYDLFEPKNARKLLRWHASTAIGSSQDKRILVDLSIGWITISIIQIQAQNRVSIRYFFGRLNTT